MSIVGLALWVNKSGLHQVRGVPLLAAIVPIATGVTPPVATSSNVITTTAPNQRVFTLVNAPQAGGINSVVINGKTYFPPDFSLSGNQLTWNGVELPAGATLEFRSFGGGDAAGHFRLEQIVVDVDGQTLFILDGQPLGEAAVIYVNGTPYPQSAGGFRVETNKIRWTTPTVVLKQTDKVYITYSRSVEADNVLEQFTFNVGPTSSKTFQLPFAPTPPGNTELFYAGQVYTTASGLTVVGSNVTLTAPVTFANGGRVTILATKEPVLTPVTPPDEGGGGEDPPPEQLPSLLFKRVTATIGANGATSLGLSEVPAYRGKSLAFVNGLGYAQGKGFALTASGLTWEDGDLDLKTTDDLRVLALNGQIVGDGYLVAELTAAAGNPTLALPQAVPDVSKAIVIVSAAGTYGGLVHFGSDYFTAPDTSHLAWSGYPLEATDKVVVAVPTRADIATSLVPVVYTVAIGETGSFSKTLSRAPVEIVLVTLNGEVLPPSAYTISGTTFSYVGPAALKVGDKIGVLFR